MGWFDEGVVIIFRNTNNSWNVLAPGWKGCYTITKRPTSHPGIWLLGRGASTSRTSKISLAFSQTLAAGTRPAASVGAIEAPRRGHGPTEQRHQTLAEQTANFQKNRAQLLRAPVLSDSCPSSFHCGDHLSHAEQARPNAKPTDYMPILCSRNSDSRCDPKQTSIFRCLRWKHPPIFSSSSDCRCTHSSIMECEERI